MSVLRVLDLTDESAVYAGRLLADLGADVVRLDAADGAARDPSYRFFNAGTRSVVVDLRRAGGSEILERLCTAADVVMDGIAPRFDDTPSLYARCRAANPRLVWVALRPFAPAAGGEIARTAGIVRYALSGLMSITGQPGQTPMLVGGGLADAITAVYGALACVLGARLARQTGDGRLVHVSGHEALLTVMQQGVYEAALSGRVVTRRGSRHAHIAMAGALPCRDGYVVISANERRMWAALVDLVGDERLRDQALTEEQSRLARQEDVFEIVGAWTQRFSKAELSELAQARGIPIAPVHSVDDLLTDPQLRSREFFQRIGDDEIPVLRVPWMRRPSPAPRPAQHTAEVLREAGFSRDEIGRLEAAGVIATGPRQQARTGA
ncbi:MAG: CaiB/BaiF CoA transferase family protein [Armatimonadota bacterium]